MRVICICGVALLNGNIHKKYGPYQTTTPHVVPATIRANFELQFSRNKLADTTVKGLSQTSSHWFSTLFQRIRFTCEKITMDVGRTMDS